MALTPILFLDHASAWGGAEQSLFLLLKHLNRNRWQPHLACVPGELAEKAKVLGIDVAPQEYPRLRRSLRFPVYGWRGARTIANLIRTRGVKIIHGNTIRASLYGALAARMAGIPFIWHMRDFWLSEARPRYPIADHLGKRWLMAQATHILTNSQAVATHLPSSDKMKVILNGVEVEQFEPGWGGSEFRARYHLSMHHPIAGVVGRLRPWKGQDGFLRAMKMVAETIPDSRFLIVGGENFGRQDDFEQKLREMAGTLGLADRVIFTGQLADIRPALAAMDVFVHPGDPEPFGLVNIEAMAMSKPVVAFGHGALPEIVVDGKTGLLVQPGNESALATATLSLLNDPATSKIMGQAGRERVEQHFSIQRVASEVETVYSEVLG